MKSTYYFLGVFLLLCARRSAAARVGVAQIFSKKLWVTTNCLTIMCAEQAIWIACVVGLEALLSYLRAIHIVSKWERDTGSVRTEKCTHVPSLQDLYTSRFLTIKYSKSCILGLTPILTRHTKILTLQNMVMFLLGNGLWNLILLEK